jgi:UDP-glucose 4-epimerase
LAPGSVKFEYTGGDRGWKGDVPVVRIATSKIRGLGWRNEHSSREALRRSMLAMIPDMKAGKM